MIISCLQVGRGQAEPGNTGPWSSINIKPGSCSWFIIRQFRENKEKIPAQNLIKVTIFNRLVLLLAHDRLKFNVSQHQSVIPVWCLLCVCSLCHPDKQTVSWWLMTPEVSPRSQHGAHLTGHHYQVTNSVFCARHAPGDSPASWLAPQ